MIKPRSQFRNQEIKSKTTSKSISLFRILKVIEPPTINLTMSNKFSRITIIQDIKLKMAIQVKVPADWVALVRIETTEWRDLKL